MKHPESQFEHDIKQTLDESQDQIDIETKHQLQRARNKALSRRNKTSMSQSWGGAIALASVTALAIGLAWDMPPSQSSFTDNIEDIELLASTEDMSLYEDLDFYLWLAAQPETI